MHEESTVKATKNISQIKQEQSIVARSNQLLLHINLNSIIFSLTTFHQFAYVGTVQHTSEIKSNLLLTLPTMIIS